jgi:hypothetical protein
MDKHRCSICGTEVDARDIAGFIEKPTCLKCANESTGLNSESESVKVAYIGGLTFAVLFGVLFYLARYVFIY